MDARNIKYAEGYFDLAVTSPPYVNAVDYPRTHQLEMYWLGFAQDSLTALKKQNVGTESVSARNYRDRHEIGVPEADKVMADIFEVETYFGSEIIKHFIKVPREERINTDWTLVLKK